MLYADDSVLLVSDKDPRVVSDNLSEELESCNEWLVDNRLLLYLGKTEAMLCGTERKIRSKEGFGVKCKDTPIDSVSEVKYLRIKIDETLSGDGILEITVKKCNGRIKFLYRQAGYLPTAVKKTQYQALVIDYAISSWYAAMTQKARHKLQTVHNKMVRFILDMEPRTHLTVDHLKELNMLRISDRARQLRLNTAHKIFYKQAPEYLQENFEKVRNRQQQHTRKRLSNFIVPNVKGNESNSFFFQAIKDWNSLPNELNTCENICSFKKGVRRHLIQRATRGAENVYVF